MLIMGKLCFFSIDTHQVQKKIFNFFSFVSRFELSRALKSFLNKKRIIYIELMYYRMWKNYEKKILLIINNKNVQLDFVKFITIFLIGFCYWFLW